MIGNIFNISDLIETNCFLELNWSDRWMGMPTIKKESVAEHSWIVSWITRVISENLFVSDSDKLLSTTYAIFHDSSEILTGDILHGVKYNQFNGEDIRNELDEYIEKQSKIAFPYDDRTNNLIREMMIGDIPNYIKQVVKLADWISMYMYLKQESHLGNSLVRPKISYCMDKIKSQLIYLENSLNKENVEFNINFLKK